MYEISRYLGCGYSVELFKEMMVFYASFVHIV